MGVQVIGSGGQQVTAVGVPTKQVNAAAVRIVGGSGGTLDHNDTTNRDAVDAHPISAITGLQDALDALTGGGGSNLRVDLAIGDEHSDIDLDAAAPGDMPAVLIWGRASGNGVYEASVVDGWTLLDPQPTLVVADALGQAPSYDQVLDSGVASIYDYSDTAGWQPVGAVPTLDGNPSQVWGPTGWVTPDGGASALADLTDVDVTSDPPAQDDVLAWDDTENKWTPATLSGGADLSDTTPQALGTAAPGVGTEASRSDHVHGLPSAADVGAAAVSHQHSASDVTSGVLDDARIPSSVARDSEVSQAVSDHDGSLTAHPDIRAAIPDPQFMRVTAIVSDETDAIVFGDPAPDDADAVLVFGRSSGDGVYSMSTVDGWELLDPQPTLVASDDLLDWVSGEPFWTGGATWFNYTAGGWQLVGSTPNLAEGNASSVWTPTGWRSGFPDPTGATAGHVWTADGLDAAEWAAPSAAGIADPGGANDDFLQRKSGAWTYRTPAQVQADLGVAEPSYYVDNQFYLLSQMNDRLGGATAVTPGTNAMAFWLIVVERTIQVDGLWFYLQATGTGAKMRFGIWAPSATTGKPTGSPLVTSAEVDVSASTGYKSQTFTPVTLTPGTYWGGVAALGAATYRTWNAGAGTPPVDMGGPDSATTVNWSFNSPWTYNSGALPDVSGFTFTATTGSAPPSTCAPFVRWRVQIP